MQPGPTEFHSGQCLRAVIGALRTSLFALLFAGAALAQTNLTTLHDFLGANAAGGGPLGDLAKDRQGALYGTAGPLGRPAQIYKLTPPTFATGSWTKTTLYAATATAPVQERLNPVILGNHGELYGTSNKCVGIRFGCVFQLVPPTIAGGVWTLNVIHAFQGAEQGDGRSVAVGKLAQDASGNLYGVTQSGGLSDRDNDSGTIYQLTPPATAGGIWTQQILYRFRNGRGGFYFPEVNVAIDTHGALYGATRSSRDMKTGNRMPGIIYQLSPPAVPGAAWTMSVINSTIGGRTVADPGTSQLTIGPGGTVFGVSTSAGGAFALKPPSVPGRAWILRLLPSDTRGGPGWELARDGYGNLYGTNYDNQTVYKLTAPSTYGGPWTFSVLHTFVGGSGGSQPYGRPLVDASGHVFGVTRTGGSGNCQNYLPLQLGCGTVFELQ